jgi:hypothetical protein
MGSRSDARFATEFSSVFMVKYMFPFICLLVFLLNLYERSSGGLAFASPLLLWGFFNATAAEVRAGERTLMYRRFLRWRAIPYTEIIECRVSWMPAVGLFKLRGGKPSWVKLYFLLPGGGFELAWPGGQTKFTSWVNAKIRGEPVEDSSAGSQDSTTTSLARRRCALVAGAGIVYAFFIHAVPSHGTNQRTWEGLPAALKLLVHLQQLAVGWPWGLVTCGWFAYVIVRQRFQHKWAWLASFLFGALLASVLIQGLNQTFGP